ncbi:MAG: MBL fold metallo-hydrolase [Candidatus Hodarchaeota archaeon]
MADSDSIIIKSGFITDEIYHLDIWQYGQSRTCSIYLLITPECVIIMDVGTSDDVTSILNFLKINNIDFKKIKYLIPSHHHFDHFGGGWKLWEIIHKTNSDVKVLTIEETKKSLQDPKDHINRAKRTFGEFIGIMEPIPDDAYELVNSDETILIPKFKKQLKLISTPGHTFDHVSLALFNDDKTEFVYLSECAGGLLNSQKFLTVPSSMPPDFNFNTYIQSLKKILNFEPLNVGYAHAGAVRGYKGVKKVLEEHIDYSFFFRDFVKNKYIERGETRFVVEQFIEQEMKERIDVYHNDLYSNYAVAVVYGQLVDLGLKKPK